MTAIGSAIDFFRRPKLFKRWRKFLHVRRMKKETSLYNRAAPGRQRQPRGRYLYASPVGEDGKPWLKKIIGRFGCEQFEYIIFAYDDTSFDEDIFRKCVVIREKGLHFYFLKKYITPSVCSNYDYLFLWCDDIDVVDFRPSEFVNIMQTNNIELAQPALTADSYFTWDITLQNKTYKVGRYVDFVEIMVPVFTSEAWVRFWNKMEAEKNYWGWGYDLFARSVCGYANMGIIDCLPVRHVRPVGARRDHNAVREVGYMMDKYAGYRLAEKVSYGALR
ncbi:MAG TPA: DUF707 domain-containing protein [Patescibacteria group bacterium]|nr:DUF707 domain-containing protein [Patescibacteria group bacterium]